MEGGGGWKCHSRRPAARCPPPPRGALSGRPLPQSGAALNAPTAAFGREGLRSRSRGGGAAHAQRWGVLPAGARSPGRPGAASLTASPGLAPRWGPAALEEIITVISATAITGTGRCSAFRSSEEARGGGVFGTRRRLRITGSCRGPTRHRGGPSAPAARMFAQAEECLPRCLEDRRVPESCLRPGQEQGAEEPPTPDSAAVGGADGGEGGTGSPRPRWLRAPSLRRCRAPPAARGRAPRCAAAIGPEAAGAARDSAAARRCAAGGRGTAGALVPGGRPDLGIAGPSSRVIFFLVCFTDGSRWQKQRVSSGDKRR